MSVEPIGQGPSWESLFVDHPGNLSRELNAGDLLTLTQLAQRIDKKKKQEQNKERECPGCGITLSESEFSNCGNYNPNAFLDDPEYPRNKETKKILDNCMENVCKNCLVYGLCPECESKLAESLYQ